MSHAQLYRYAALSRGAAIPQNWHWPLALLLCCAALALCGCAIDPVLAKVSYDGPAIVTSTKTASLRLQTGVVEGASGTSLAYAGPNVFIPVATGPNPELQFNLQDQQIFVESLKDELNRLNILRVAQVSTQRVEGTDVAIDIVFTQTTHRPGLQEYYLNVAMQIQGGQRTFAKRYEVLSSEGENAWTKMNTNVAQGKALAGRKLMAKLMPDIEAFLKSIE